MADAYERLVARGALADDGAQREVARRLERIAQSLTGDNQARGWLGRMRRREPVKGAYIYGDVGRGKTLLLDLFFQSVQLSAKRRVHFHQFMDEVHAAITRFRQSRLGEEGRTDPIDAVTRPIIAQTRLLCLDEFHVNDITNAMLLKRLFDRLFEGGVVLVATSNLAPQDLYHNGLNRQLFVPFIESLQAHTDILHLCADKDYRREKFGGAPVFAFGLEKDEARERMDAVWDRLTGQAEGEPGLVRALGRNLVVPRQALGVARFKFKQLCEVPLGARDYLRLVQAYDAFVVDDVPVLDTAHTDAAKRFINFIDTVYDRRAKLAASFAAPLEHLLGDERRRFEFARTQSRLLEMQSQAYLEAPLRPLSTPHAPAG